MPYFTFTDASNETFVVRLTDAGQIAHARALLAGTETGDARIGGTITKAPAEHNIGWSYQIAPDDVFFFEMSTEVGDSTMRYIETHLREVGGHLLPGRVWTGWSSELTGELKGRFGTDGNDILHGATSTDDMMLGRCGNDILLSYGGNDHLSGGQGNDILQGGRGNDKLGGGSGADILQGDWGDDFLDGGRGNDLLVGGDGRDVFRGPDSGDCETDMIGDFEGGRGFGDQIRLDHAWLREVGDINGDGQRNRMDLAAAFEKRGDDLVLCAGDATIVLEGAAGMKLHANDFLIG